MPPEPLAPGTVLGDRFEIESVLGSGGFSIVYLAQDRARRDRVAIKELAPAEARRGAACVLDLGPDSHRLRRKFMEEAALQTRLRIDGLVPVRSWFSENGTSYVVSDHLPNARTLASVVRERHVLPVDEALIYFYSLLEIVEALHAKGVLHRDIKPSNVLVEEDIEPVAGPSRRSASPTVEQPRDGAATGTGKVWLIDFGAAREWQFDAHTQTVLFTPGFAPPEQLSEKAKRGPATDIYALCATLYQMLTGAPPPAVADRAGGAEPDLARIAQAAGPKVARAIGLGLSLKIGDRPQSVQELREALESDSAEACSDDLETLDDLLYRSQHFSFRKRQCPACGGVLSEPHPLRRGVCPVCREGRIEHREIHAKLCPVCRAGVLHRHENTDPAYICTVCGKGVLKYRRQGLLGRERSSTCPQCGAINGHRPGRATASPSTLETSETGVAPRAAVVWACDSCEAQYDEQPDSRWKQVVPMPGRWTSLYPDEWARVAVGLDPGAGNAECSNCGAEYHLEGQNMTLLGTHHDPNGFAEDYEGRRLQIEDARWLGVGKSSPHRGFVCEDCGTEFDFAGSGLLLVHSKNRRLCAHVEECRTLEDWHRVAQGLPPLDRVGELEAAIPEALRGAYLEGSIGFDGRKELLWKGPAVRTQMDQESTLTVDLNEISFGGLLRKWKVRTTDVVACEAAGERVVLTVRGEEEPIEFELRAMDLTAHLKSGAYTVSLTGEDLCQRLARQ